MQVKEEDEEAGAVPTGVEVRSFDKLRRTRFVVETCCSDCFNSCSSGVLNVLDSIAIVFLYPSMLIFAIIPGAWVITVLVFYAVQDLFTANGAAILFLLIGFGYLGIVPLYDVYATEDADEPKTPLTDMQKLVYHIFGWLRAALSVFGFIVVTNDCINEQFSLPFDFENPCPTELVLRYIGHAFLFVEPYFLIVIFTWPEYYQKYRRGSCLSADLLFFKFAIETFILLVQIYAGLAAGLAVAALVIALGVAWIPSLIAVHFGQIPFYIGGIVALSTQDPVAEEVTIWSFIVLNWSYFIAFAGLFILEEQEWATKDVPWLRFISREWPKEVKMVVVFLLFLRFVGATTASVFYVIEGCCNRDVVDALAIAAIVTAIIDPLLLLCAGFPRFKAYLEEISKRYTDTTLPMAAPANPTVSPK